ncbi:unnamed protein product [Paramecium sonneborni]|uniref:Uncharacterized protein n=1 Tax=Paramecium sonneborni TaxID=65129 RepID=A0A8S1KMK7_9CILI|nr:unnamed protein product [Paramecium sonneborni]
MQKQQPQLEKSNQKPQIKKANSFDDEDKLEIIKLGYGINEALKLDILEYYKASRQQQEFKNPADFVKHRLDNKYGPYWFVFMWDRREDLNAQFSYYNTDDKVFEFEQNGWHMLIYSFNQAPQPVKYQPQSSGQTLPQFNMQQNMQSYDHNYYQQEQQFNGLSKWQY